MSREYKLTQKDMDTINAILCSNHSIDDFFAFTLVLADTVDVSDNEAFSDAALVDIAKHAIGKKGYVKYLKSPSRECFIFKAEVIEDATKKDPLKGNTSKSVKVYCCMPNTEMNKEAINYLRSKHNISLSTHYGVSNMICSCCGSSVDTCLHQKGCTYDGVLCCSIITDVYDFYGFEIDCRYNERTFTYPFAPGDIVYQLEKAPSSVVADYVEIDKIEITALKGARFHYVQCIYGPDTTEIYSEGYFTEFDVGKTMFVDEEERDKMRNLK
ncbi:MAG: hypothetical protein IJ341_02435 [Bacteroidales bacterium]|nr:hypothetical protein [Bacteroidales bacterium]